MKQTLSQWYSQQKITLAQAQLLSEIIEPHIPYTLAELNLLVQLPITYHLPQPGQKVPPLTKYQKQSFNWQLASFWATNWKWLLPCLILLIYLLIK